MLLERTVLVICWTFAILLLRFTIPQGKGRDAILVFLFKQLMTWIFGILVVQFGLITYPVREFPNATNTSFSFEYFIYPATCVAFVLHFPEEKSRLHKIGWYLFFPTWMTILEVIIQKYTALIDYIHWSWFWTWITLLITFSISHRFYLWYTKHGSVTTGRYASQSPHKKSKG
ncbi:CBO0543 family protein [Paenibacillus oryzisoli]|uniref:CBO0543 family protein n=1 Tax=Paenibacillus oryzisoli TaxID=1850517 RepID=UPI003D2B3669